MAIPPIIATAGARRPDAASRVATFCALAAIAWGIAAALFYAHEGLTLSHYDAKGHLVVARRVLDSLTPTWRQIGAVWLPLPHLLNLLPVQIDALYRTGASAVAISVASFAIAAYASARVVMQTTGSAIASVLAVALLLANPNLLYLQATPMTEPLLVALLLVATWRLEVWSRGPAVSARRAAGWALAAAVLTRYEAWPFTAAGIVLACAARWRRSEQNVGAVVRGGIELAAYPAIAIAAFLVNSRLSTGVWFVTSGFFVPDPALEGRLIGVTTAVWWGVWELGSLALACVALVAAAVVLVGSLRGREHSSALVVLALGAAGSLPWYAFYEGHPFRIRYMVPLVAASATISAVAIGWLPRRVRAIAAIVLFVLVVRAASPFDPRAPMVVEAQWDVRDSRGREAVTRCLAARRPGEAVLASMGSLAHYMQELSHAGFGIADFVHEGNGEIWWSALRTPKRYTRWILVEEKAEGGDVLAHEIREHPAFVAGYSRVCRGGGVALYRLDEPRQRR